MPGKVFLTQGAARDLEELDDFLSRRETPEKAERVLTRIEQAFAGLSPSPRRGPYPQELLALGIREYRQVFFKPYRIIYRVIDGNVYILLITDGPRDMRMLLQRRLLEDG